VSRRRRPLSRRLMDRRGAALILALMVLVGLSAIMLALLSVGAIEPQISRNHLDLMRARYLAEAGIEQAYDTLAVNAGAWSDYLTGATCTAGAVLADASLPGSSRTQGHFTVLVRNDCGPGDEALTGVARDAIDPARDANGKVIVSSTGVAGRTSQTITVVVSDERVLRAPGQSVPRSSVMTYNWAER
jgi:Tfp pilus assembly protein PilX